ncbi:TonB-dependent receptor plug domain-containing protein [Halopseudomonas maritima]|uniref:TonB-dependent receptor plug domain-containing protein n=1 Tax=Halopseudomonas maritima TaxID=2918528 RepID=UPI001EEA4C26|nr:TonB-dependent receptor plug domain-containing protein [Halopseudomonas maritima]UJJ32689.1 TonB-dependent receptor plug domain-containing protein [Halopseudomonas maritima]
MHDLNALRRSHLACAIAIATFCSATQAADSSESITLDTMVITAAATEQSLRDAPASITVLTEEDIKRTPVTDLADLLGRVAGVTLQRSGNTVPGVQIRGFDQAYTLILIDGRRVNSTSASFRGNDYDTGWVPVDMIERIRSSARANVIAVRLRRHWRRSQHHHQKGHRQLARQPVYHLHRATAG